MCTKALKLYAHAATSYDTNTSWMEEHLSIPYIVYSARDNQRSHRHPNFGKEALGYLMFIAEYYHCLPKVTYHHLAAPQML